MDAFLTKSNLGKAQCNSRTGHAERAQKTAEGLGIAAGRRAQPPSVALSGPWSDWNIFDALDSCEISQ
jgi:hypothetical protein